MLTHFLFRPGTIKLNDMDYNELDLIFFYSAAESNEDNKSNL